MGINLYHFLFIGVFLLFSLFYFIFHVILFTHGYYLLSIALKMWYMLHLWGSTFT